jgi:hypothetical protein
VIELYMGCVIDGFLIISLYANTMISSKKCILSILAHAAARVND